ncbi:hypothetical protein SUGI_0510600 [Cryptomeria japonica]|nr:hypothetical protein SUGI_0510600 [Cryptomeria japonica]
MDETAPYQCFIEKSIQATSIPASSRTGLHAYGSTGTGSRSTAFGYGYGADSMGFASDVRSVDARLCFFNLKGATFGGNLVPYGDTVGRDAGSTGYGIGTFGVDAATFPLIASPLATHACTAGGAYGTNIMARIYLA